ncbi:MAG: tetratricopeptide repeat protein [Myxococcaceae bacterium]|nr:tetratricopeptide repeat protein [Myxococcaceae bacterium]
MALGLTLALAYTPAEAQALFTEANDAYYRQEYSAAKDKYERLIAAGQSGPDVLFNLGTTHLAANELGPAILFLTRAARLAPSDDDIAAQLAVAQQRQLDQVVGAEDAEPFLQRLGRAVDERLVSWGFLIAWWVAFGLLFVFLRGSSHRWAFGLATAAVFAVALGLGGLVGVQAWVSTSVKEAVVMAATAKAREFPGDTAKVAFEVHAGLLVRVMEDSGRFVRIRLPNALEGWVEKEQVTPL